MRLNQDHGQASHLDMKSCLSLLFVMVIFIAIVGGAALLWHLSNTTEFSRASQAPTNAAEHGR